MYYYTTTIDEQGMADVLLAMRSHVNGLVRKHNPFEIVTTTEPLDAHMASVTVTRFHLSVVGDVEFKNDAQVVEFHAAIVEALEEVRQLNEANYVVVAQAARPQRH